MKVVMFTNTFVPHLGGVTRSVLTLRSELEKRGHAVMIVAPSYDGHHRDHQRVLRVPAISHVAGSDYAMPIPMSRHIRDEIEAFSPDVVHSHHPFLLGSTALRTAAALGVPSVYTCHTRYDLYTEGLARVDGAISRLAGSLTSGYASLADAVIAPSESIRELLREQGVSTETRVIPTGIDLEAFGRKDRTAMRQRLGIGPDDFVVGHLGRLAVEKNLDFMAEAVAKFLASCPRARFILSGRGPKRAAFEGHFAATGVGDRVVMVEALERTDVAGFYAAMDVFAFTSLSETQGLVVTEALASSCPVVALDAPGVREAISGESGLLLDADASPEAFARALASFERLSGEEMEGKRRAARAASLPFSVERMGSSIEALYRDVIARNPSRSPAELDLWDSKWRELSSEIGIVENLLRAVGVAARPDRTDASS